MLNNTDLKTITKNAMNTAGLSTRERDVLELRFWQGMDRAATRKRLSISKTRTLSLENRALRKLRMIAYEPGQVVCLASRKELSSQEYSAKVENNG